MALASTFAVLACSSAAQAVVPGANGNIAFATDRDGNFEIYTIRSDGAGARNLTRNPARDEDPELSPDGERIAFVSDRDGHREIYVMNADGSGQTRVTNTTATTDNSAPSWAPDGQTIVFQTNAFGNSELASIKPDGTGRRRLTFSPADDRSPAFSPAGDRIAFASNRDGDFEIYSASTTGGDLRQVTRNSVPDDHPAWSPDGTVIAYDSVRAGNGDLYAVKPDGSDLVRLTSEIGTDAFPSYSPDGTRIAYAGERAGDQNVYTVAAVGGAQTRVTSGSAADTMPSWGRLPASTPPETGRTATATPATGSVTFQLPRGHAFLPLDGAVAVPIGATVDTTKGSLRLVTADAQGGVQAGDFHDGVFEVAQKVGSATTELKLTGGDFDSCPTAKAGSAAKAKVVRKLWGSASGRFKTTGRYASAVIRGTKWLIADRCDGTLVRVTQGSVTVRDLPRKRTVVVRAGHKYLVKKP